jgi:predicted nucleic acid-binding protein
MACVCLDVMPLTHLVNEVGWYRGLRKDIENRNVTVWIADGKYKQEISRNLKVKSWLNRLAEVGRARSVDAEKFNLALKEISSHRACKCKECDDPHLFSLCWVAGAAYLFTEDKRISRCRTKLKRVPQLKKYCKTGLIYRQKEYHKNRTKVLS